MHIKLIIAHNYCANYNQIRIGMKAEEVSFEIKPWTITHQIEEAIRSQIQYYFSRGNLVTDLFLRNIIASSKGGWVAIKTLARFNNIQTIFKENFSKELPGGIKKVIIRRCCESSKLLQVNIESLRRKDKSAASQHFNSLLYFEGQIDAKQVEAFLNQKGVDSSTFHLKKGESWFFIDFKERGQKQMEQINQWLDSKPEWSQGGRILKGRQFIAAQKEYARIVGILPINSPLRESQAKYRIPPGRILSHRQTQQFKIPRKIKLTKFKGKHNKTRLPRAFLIDAARNRHSIQEQQLIYIEGCEPRKVDKTVEEVSEYRAKKVAEKKLKKAKERKEREMAIQVGEEMEEEGEAVVIQKMIEE